MTQRACINYGTCQCNPEIKEKYCDPVKYAMARSWDMGAKVIKNSDETAQDLLGMAMKNIIELYLKPNPPLTDTCPPEHRPEGGE